MTRCLRSLDILVLAGGLGTRIRAVSGDLPKLLVPISGRPYLDHLLDWLRRFGARRIVLSLGYQARAVIDYLRMHSFPNIELDIVVEPCPLGTARAIRFARHELRSDPVLVMNGDSLTDANLCAFIDHYRNAGALGSILCTEVDDAGRYGRIELDGRGRIRRFVEKDAAFHGSALISAGIYLFSAALLDDIAAGNSVSLERDVFERLPPGSLAANVGRFRFIDIGTPESLATADKVIAEIVA